MKKTRFILYMLVLLLPGLLVLPLSAQSEPAATEEPDTAADDAAMEAAMELPDVVTIAVPSLFPEGVEWDAERGHFLVGSLTMGTIHAVADDGTVTPLIEADDLYSTVGLHIDAGTDRLLIPIVSQFAQSEEAPAAALAAYDLETGERLYYVDLEAVDPELGRYFANDVTADADGNAYVTNSFSPVIYQVTPEGEASVFLQTDDFAGQGFNLNGIDYHPDGYLLVAKASEGRLFKVPVDDPEAYTEVALDEPLLGADGIVYDPEAGRLYVVSGSLSTVFALSSDDDWSSATIDDRVETEEPATTAALRDGAVYVVYAQLSQLGSQEPPESFDIGRVVFENLPTDG